jgi:hypothetical protein
VSNTILLTLYNRKLLSSLIRIFDFIEDSAINNTSLGAERFSIDGRSDYILNAASLPMTYSLPLLESRTKK